MKKNNFVALFSSSVICPNEECCGSSELISSDRFLRGLYDLTNYAKHSGRSNVLLEDEANIYFSNRSRLYADQASIYYFEQVKVICILCKHFLNRARLFEECINSFLEQVTNGSSGYTLL